MSIQSWSTRDENNIGCDCINAKCQKWRMGAGWMTGSQRGVRTWRRPWAFCVFFCFATCNADEWTVEWMKIENCNACHNPEYATEKLEWCINAAPDQTRWSIEPKEWHIECNDLTGNLFHAASTPPPPQQKHVRPYVCPSVCLYGCMVFFASLLTTKKN